MFVPYINCFFPCLIFVLWFVDVLICIYILGGAASNTVAGKFVTVVAAHLLCCI